LPAAFCTSAFALASASALRASSATEPPEAANSLAMARPSPVLEPVITATRPSMRTSIISSALGFQFSDCRQDTLGRRRRVKPHCGLALSGGRNGVLEGVPDRGREHQRRLADRLGPEDRRLLRGRIVEHPDIEDRRRIAAAGNLVGRGTDGAQAALGIPPQLLAGKPSLSLHEGALDLA